MKSIDFDLNTNLNEAVRIVKAKSYEIGERDVGEFNDFIIDSNKSEEDDIIPSCDASDSGNGMTKQEALNKIKGLKAVLPAASNEIDEIINVLSK